MSPFRPLPTYDGSAGPLPATDVDNNYLLARYAITKPTLFKRRDALVENGWVVPGRLGSRVYYSAQDVHLLDCLHYWAKSGHSITEVVNHLKQQEGAYQGGGVDWQAKSKALELPREQAVETAAEKVNGRPVAMGLQTSSKDLLQLGEELAARLVQQVGEAMRVAAPEDALAGHEFLNRAAKQQYLLPGKVLAKGLGLKGASVSGWSERTEKLGFVITRVANGQHRVQRGAREAVEADG